MAQCGAPPSLSLSFPPRLQVNLGLLVFSLLGFLLPAYLFHYRAQLRRELATHGPDSQMALAVPKVVA